MNNAYHFYSPEPGPASLMWFCIEYEQEPDGTRNFRWVLMPDLRPDGHDYDPDETRVWSGTEYTRRLSLAENAGHPAQPPWYWYHLLERRLQAGKIQDIPDISPMKIPYPNQYREPNIVSKRWIQAYVRHVAHTYRHQDKPELRVTGVKFYQVIHQFLSAGLMAAGVKPNDNKTYWPYYCGDFDADGNMKETCFLLDDQDPQASYRDPFLYFLIPIDSLIKHAEGRSGMIPWGFPDKGAGPRFPDSDPFLDRSPTGSTAKQRLRLAKLGGASTAWPGLRRPWDTSRLSWHGFCLTYCAHPEARSRRSGTFVLLG
jgi:hypothetical protein